MSCTAHPGLLLCVSEASCKGAQKGLSCSYSWELSVVTALQLDVSGVTALGAALLGSEPHSWRLKASSDRQRAGFAFLLSGLFTVHSRSLGSFYFSVDELFYN